MITKNFKKRFFTSIFLLLLVLLIFNFDIILIYSLLVLGVLSILEFLQISKKIIKRKMNFLILNLFFTTYIFIFCIIFIYFSINILTKYILFILLFGCVASDTGGFLFGKLFGGPKLTKISPNKTYTGAAGSLTLTILVISFLFFYFLDIFNFKIVILSLIVSIFCQMGDLLFSFLKRKANLKDTGNFLPGHGGILDRIDGILLGIPLGIITLAILS
tara:strand:+ start:623 stop:1273 length:651 start_codon:yes stop_codon:yes gene_type:complete